MFFGKEVKKVPEKYKRINFVKGYDYLEKISDNECRYVGVSEMNMNLPKMGDEILKYMTKTMCYKQGVDFRKKVLKVPTNEYGKRLVEKKEFYDKIEALLYWLF